MNNQSYLLDRERRQYTVGIRSFDNRNFYERIKRAADIGLSIIALVLLSPIVILTCIVVVLDSKGSPIFIQERIGLRGKKFKIYKIRSMNVNAEAALGPQLAQVNDSRITRVGRIIRKIRLDEIPQLVNVIKGDMSIVGPRPEREFFYDKYSIRVPEFYTRLEVRPGITGLAQVSGDYDLPPEDKLRFDKEYIRHRGILTDLKIIVKTILVVFAGRGAR